MSTVASVMPNIFYKAMINVIREAISNDDLAIKMINSNSRDSALEAIESNRSFKKGVLALLESDENKSNHHLLIS
jgi:hypothetical protein